MVDALLLCKENEALGGRRVGSQPSSVETIMKVLHWHGKDNFQSLGSLRSFTNPTGTINISIPGQQTHTGIIPLIPQGHK